MSASKVIDTILYLRELAKALNQRNAILRQALIEIGKTTNDKSIKHYVEATIEQEKNICLPKRDSSQGNF